MDVVSPVAEVQEITKFGSPRMLELLEKAHTKCREQWKSTDDKTMFPPVAYYTGMLPHVAYLWSLCDMIRATLEREEDEPDYPSSATLKRMLGEERIQELINNVRVVGLFLGWSVYSAGRIAGQPEAKLPSYEFNSMLLSALSQLRDVYEELETLAAVFTQKKEG